jgi:lycopene cyclase CruA
VSEILERLRHAGGDALVQRLLRLDAHLPAAPTGQAFGPSIDAVGPSQGAATDCDVVLLGGGLSLLYAPLLAQAGLKVAVVDQHRIGDAQREWNASEAELQALVTVGLLSAAQLQALIMARYTHGICAWHGGQTQKVWGVLDRAIDATALLQLARQRCVAAGVLLLDGCRIEAVAPGSGGLRVEMVTETGQKRHLSARLGLDGRGAQSPHATADLVCPTVGGVFTGLAFDPHVGDILVTTEDAENGRQHIWEAFPGRPGEITIYLFYYALRTEVAPGALQSLYERFFSRLSAYKPGTPTLVRPTFGYIPGWSRMSPAPRSPHPRLLLLGDAAARHSPLTFCGFGAALRSLQPVTQAVKEFLLQDSHNMRPGPAPLPLDDQALHGATGALAYLMAKPPRSARPAALNQLLNTAFTCLQDMGNDSFAALLQDRLPLRKFVQFLRRTARLRPSVYALMVRSLGPAALLRWSVVLAQALWRQQRLGSPLQPRDLAPLETQPAHHMGPEEEAIGDAAVPVVQHMGRAQQAHAAQSVQRPQQTLR